MTDHDLRHMFDQTTWEERYGSPRAVWSGNPNPQLVTEASDLPDGTALDVGCGEGADAIWLASRGWTVTAADFSRTALARAATHAADAGVADRITWTHADLRTTSPDGPFDLVSAQYLYLLPDLRHALFARLAAAVAPGGTLLVVGHDLAGSTDHPMPPEIYYTAEEIAGTLDPDAWAILVSEARPRPLTDAAARHRSETEGHEHSVPDTVLRASRRT